MNYFKSLYVILQLRRNYFRWLQSEKSTRSLLGKQKNPLHIQNENEEDFFTTSLNAGNSLMD